MRRRYLHRIYRWLHSFGLRGRRRFTRGGLLVLWSLLFAAGFGLDTSFSMAYQGAAFLACLAALAVGWGTLSRARFAAIRILPRYGTVGCPLPYRLRLENLTSRPQQRLVLFEDLDDPRPSLEEFRTTPEPGEENRNWFDRFFGYYRWRWLVHRNTGAEVAPLEVDSLAPRERREVRHTLRPSRRGVLQLNSLTVTWPDPLGLFRGARAVACPQSIVVLPKRYPLRPLALPGRMKYQPGGVALASSVGESEEFISLREYRPGDPMRHVHWRSWAKAGKPIVKEFEDEFFVRHALILDTFSPNGDGHVFEEAVAVAASFACTIPDQDSLLDLLFVGPQAFRFTAGRGLAHPQQMLEILAAVKICHEKAFAALEELVMEHVTALSGCVCVFLAWDGPRQRLVERLRFLDIPVTVLVITAGDDEAPLLPGPLADCPERLRRLQAGRIAEGLAAL